MTTELIKRTWAYLHPPKEFEVAPCECGNTNTQWSEFEGHCWCDQCQQDFVPVHKGVFDGPVQIKTAAMMGIRFDRVILATQEIEVFDIDSGEYRSVVVR